jgi:rubrerythrin
MDKFESVDDILEFAIAGEVAANQFYMELAGKMENPAMAKVFEDFAKEELGHKSKLEAIKQGEMLEPTEKVAELKIADYLVDTEPKPDMDYKDALVLAMKKEKAAYRLYLDLAAVAEAEELTNMFLYIAQEEAKHKLRFEIEYDEVVLKEN